MKNNSFHYSWHIVLVQSPSSPIFLATCQKWLLGWIIKPQSPQLAYLIGINSEVEFLYSLIVTRCLENIHEGGLISEFFHPPKSVPNYYPETLT